VAANHSAGDPLPAFEDYRAHGFFTDDHGDHFQLSESVTVPGSNESTAAELSNDQLMLNSRNQKGNIRARIVSISGDGGRSWDSSYVDQQLPDPVCEGSLLNIGWKRGKAVLAFCNPASRERRDSLTLRISWNEGLSWKTSIVIKDVGERGDRQAYCDLEGLTRKRLGVLYERGGYWEIIFRRVSIRR